MPKQIQSFRVSQKLVRLFGLKGRYQPVLDETIVPVIDVGESETRRYAYSGGFAPAVAGERSFFYLQNVRGDGVNMVVTKVTATLGAGGAIILDNPNAGFTLGSATVAGRQWGDTDQAGLPKGICVYGSDAGAVPVGSAQYLVGTARRDALFEEYELLIGEGWTTMWISNTVNIAMRFAIEWYEYDIVQSS